MIDRIKTGATLAWDGLFGNRFGFFDLMAEAGKFPIDTTPVARLHSAANANRPATAAAQRPAAPVQAGVREAA